MRTSAVATSAPSRRRTSRAVIRRFGQSPTTPIARSRLECLASRWRSPAHGINHPPAAPREPDRRHRAGGQARLMPQQTPIRPVRRPTQPPRCPKGAIGSSRRPDRESTITPSIRDRTGNQADGRIEPMTDSNRRWPNRPPRTPDHTAVPNRHVENQRPEWRRAEPSPKRPEPEPDDDGPNRPIEEPATKSNGNQTNQQSDYTAVRRTSGQAVGRTTADRKPAPTEEPAAESTTKPTAEPATEPTPKPAPEPSVSPRTPRRPPRSPTP